MVGFTKPAAERIKQATIIVERMTQGTGGNHKRLAAFQPVGFWAKINDEYTNSRYGWTALEPQDDDTLDTNEDWGSGSAYDETGYAVEVTGSQSVLTDSIVWMMPSKNQNYYVFFYAPGLVNAKVGSTDIPEATGSGTITPGNGEVTIKRWSITSDAFEDGDTLDVYNPFKTEIPKNTWVELTYGDGVWWISGADCDEEET